MTEKEKQEQDKFNQEYSYLQKLTEDCDIKQAEIERREERIRKEKRSQEAMMIRKRKQIFEELADLENRKPAATTLALMFVVFAMVGYLIGTRFNK
jgi:hypothetical protein